MRLILKHSPVRPTRMFWSVKNEALYFMESGLERDFALRCEFDPQVLAYRCQPEPLYYSLPGESKRRRYTPDTLLEHSVLGLSVIEVKPERYAQKPALQAKHAQLEQLYAEQHIRFLVMTERHIRQGYFTRNLSNLYRFRRFDIDLDALLALKQRFPNGMRLGDVEAELKQNEGWLSLAYQALAHRHAQADLTVPLSSETQLEWTP